MWFHSVIYWGPSESAWAPLWDWNAVGQDKTPVIESLVVVGLKIPTVWSENSAMKLSHSKGQAS